MPRGRVLGPDPRWADEQIDESGARIIPAPPPTTVVNAPPGRSEFNPPAPDNGITPEFLRGSGRVQPVPTIINAPPGRSEFNPPPDEPGITPDFLRGSGGGTPQPDPIQITGVSRRMEIDPIELNGTTRVAQVANRGVPGGGDADRLPEPPPGPQAIQGVPEMLARPPAAQAARLASKPKMARSVAPGQAQTPSAPVLQDSGGSTSPDFEAYVAQRAKEIADVKAAQGMADQARRWQDIANGFVRAGDVASGRKTDEQALQQRLENTQQPVQNVLQQQQVGRQATADALAQTSLSGKMWEQRMATQAADPNSAISQRTQGFLASTGLFPKGAEKFVSAAEFEHALKAGSEGIHALALKADILHKQQEVEIQRGKAAEDIRHHNQEYDVGMVRAHPSVQPAQQVELEALINGAASLGDLASVNDNASWPNRIGSAFGIGPAAETRKAVAPEVAKAGARGRVNPAGEVKEANSLPGPNTAGGSDNLRTRRQNMLRDADAKLRVLEHDPRVEPNSVAQMRQQLNDEIARGGDVGSQGGTGNAPAARPRRTANGETREWNGKAWVPING